MCATGAPASSRRCRCSRSPDVKRSRTSASCPLRKTSCHRRREEKFPPQRRRGAENAEEYANSHCLCDLCVLCASAVKGLVLLLTAWGSKPTFGASAFLGVNNAGKMIFKPLEEHSEADMLDI